VPAVVNFCAKVWPCDKSGDLKEADTISCESASLFVQVTIAPALTVISAGVKEKSLIEMLIICPAIGTGGKTTGAELVALVAGTEVATAVGETGAGATARGGTGLSVIVKEFGKLVSIVVSTGSIFSEEEQPLAKSTTAATAKQKKIFLGIILSLINKQSLKKRSFVFLA
jgi:hypothetical protein